MERADSLTLQLAPNWKVTKDGEKKIADSISRATTKTATCTKLERKN